MDLRASRTVGAAALLATLAALTGAARAQGAAPDAARDVAPLDAGTIDSRPVDAGVVDSRPVDTAPPVDAAPALPPPDVGPGPAPVPTPEPASEPAPEPASSEPVPAERNFVERLLDLPGEWTSKGDLALDGRVFPDDDNAATIDHGLGLQGRLELRHRHGPFDEKVRVYGRMDHYDEQRSTLAWEEAFIQVGSERVRLRAGLDIVNWTATEAFHPADVINARNLDSDLENLEKIGEPMVALLLRPFGESAETTVTLLALPYRSEPIFASQHSRLNFGSPMFDLRGTRRMLDRRGRFTDDNWGPQGAIAVRQVLGPVDLTLHVLEHMDRSQPLVLFDPMVLRPFLLFQTVRQVGGTYQHAIGALLLKLEGAYRHFIDPQDPLPGVPLTVFTAGLPDHGQLALGLEYGVTHEGGPESTFLLEGQTLLGVSGATARAQLSVFQRDVLVGYRFALNDESSKEFLFGAIFDLERSGETLFNFSYQQRLDETWTLRAGLRLFHAKPDSPSPLATLRKSDHLRLTLTRHF
jgi:hypothetical protein